MINVELDPRLNLPPVKGVEHKEEPYKTIPESDSGTEIEVSLEDITAGDTAEPGPDTLDPPSNVVVVSQTSRMTDTGQMVIDVLLDVVDPAGASEYEVRMAV